MITSIELENARLVTRPRRVGLEEIAVQVLFFPLGLQKHKSTPGISLELPVTVLKVLRGISEKAECNISSLPKPVMICQT